MIFNRQVGRQILKDTWGTVRFRGLKFFVLIVAKTSVTDKSFNLIRPEQVPTDGNDLKILLRDAFSYHLIGIFIRLNCGLI